MIEEQESLLSAADSEPKIDFPSVLKQLVEDRNGVFKDFLTVTNANHTKNIDVTLKECLYYGGLMVVSLPIAITGAWGYLGLAKEAAMGSTPKVVLNCASSLTYNVPLNEYYMTLNIDRSVEAIFSSDKPEVIEAINHLKKYQNTIPAKTLRALEKIGIAVSVLVPTIMASYPNYVLARKGSHYSGPVAFMSATSSGVQTLEGVRSTFYDALPPVVTDGFRKLRRMLGYETEKHRLYQAMLQLKNAAVDAVDATSDHCLKLMQEKKDAPLKKLYPLLNQKPGADKNGLIKSGALYYSLQAMTKSSPIKPLGFISAIIYSFYFYMIFQLLNQAAMLASNASLFKLTEGDAAEFAQIEQESRGAFWLGLALFLVNILLGAVVAWYMAAGIYNRFRYALHGFQKLAQESTGLADFISNFLKNSSSVFIAPLFLQQSPWLSVLLGVLVAFAVPSANPTLYLNQLMFGEDTSKYLDPGTIFHIVLFNFSPYLPLCESACTTYKRKYGTQEEKNQISLIQFFSNQKNCISNTHPEKFLESLLVIALNSHLTKKEKEALLRVKLGGSPDDALGADSGLVTADKQGKQGRFKKGIQGRTEAKFRRIVPRIWNGLGFFAPVPSDEKTTNYGTQSLQPLQQEIPRSMCIMQ